VTRRIIPCGGRELFHPQLVDYVLSFARRPRPKVLFLPTASGDSPGYLLTFYQQLAGRDLALDHLLLFDRTVDDLDALIREQDVIVVGGGNTANMLAIWRVHGVETVLREAWEQGIVLAGTSAGAICWFESGVTDSFGEELAPLRCLGFLPGSNCPHYDSEPQRRPTYRRLVDAAELPPGLAAEDGVGLHFVGIELAEAVAGRPEGRAFRVEPGSETALPVRRLG